MRYFVTGGAGFIGSNYVRGLLSGQWGNNVSGVTVFDLSVDGVGYSTTGGYIDDIVDELEAYKAQIISGEITVPATP